MENPIVLILLVTVITLTATSVLFFSRTAGWRGLAAAGLLSALLVGSFGQPALAAAAKERAMSPEQRELNADLRKTPNGNQYQGIEYPDVDGAPLSDRAIRDRIESKVPSDLALSVSSGAVRLSGKVDDLKEAQSIVQSVKEIPGVHEVSYDLGLSDINGDTSR